MHLWFSDDEEIYMEMFKRAPALLEILASWSSKNCIRKNIGSHKSGSGVLTSRFLGANKYKGKIKDQIFAPHTPSQEVARFRWRIHKWDFNTTKYYCFIFKNSCITTPKPCSTPDRWETHRGQSLFYAVPDSVTDERHTSIDMARHESNIIFTHKLTK